MRRWLFNLSQHPAGSFPFEGANTLLLWIMTSTALYYWNPQGCGHRSHPAPRTKELPMCISTVWPFPNLSEHTKIPVFIIEGLPLPSKTEVQCLPLLNQKHRSAPQTGVLAPRFCCLGIKSGQGAWSEQEHTLTPRLRSKPSRRANRFHFTQAATECEHTLHPFCCRSDLRTRCL